MWTGLCFCMTPVCFFFFFVLFTSTVQKSQALSQYTLNKVSKAAGSRCRISQYICTNEFHYCILATWHTRGLLQFEHGRVFNQPTSITSDTSINGVCKNTAIRPNLILTDHHMKLSVAFLPLSDHFRFTFPNSAAVFLWFRKDWALFHREDKVQSNASQTSQLYCTRTLQKLLDREVKHQTYLFTQRSPWTAGHTG